MTLTAVYCPSIVAMIYKGLPIRDSAAVPMLTIFRVRMVLDTAPEYSRVHSSSGMVGEAASALHCLLC